MRDSDFRDVEFAESISEAVLGILGKERFFERLDDRFCPADPSKDRVTCGHSYIHTTEILRELGMDSEEVQDVLAVMGLRGGCCDCEILYNVAEESRLKAEHWKAHCKELTADN